MIVHHKKIVGSNDGNTGRWRERIYLLAVTIILALLFLKLSDHYKRKFVAVEQAYNDTTALNLSPGFDENKLCHILRAGNYFQNDTGLRFAAARLKEKIEAGGKQLANLGALNKSNFDIKIQPGVNYADSGGEELQERIDRSYKELNIDDATDSARTTPLSSAKVLGNGARSIYLKVRDGGRQPVQGVLVQLHCYTCTPSETAYAVTDADGRASFSGLKDSGAYSVLPIGRGYEYGAPKGTDRLVKDMKDVQFVQSVHSIKLLDPKVYKQLKDDNVLTARTPAQFTSGFLRWCLIVLGAFWIVHALWSLSRKAFDQSVLPVLMLLTGLCVLTMYAIHDPLRDLMYGSDMALGVLVGLLCLLVLSFLDVIWFYNSRMFDFSGMSGRKRFNQPGYVYLLLAIVLAFCLFGFGKGPEGSGVKINLSVFGILFQPSEISKFLVVVFFAAYFTRNASYFKEIPSASVRFRKSLRIICGLGGLMFLYLLLGDMGPALVLCALFIAFYSVARGSFFPGIFYLAIIIAVFVLGGNLYNAGKTVSSSSPRLYSLGEKMSEVGERLNARNEIFINKWDNQTLGGDQVAHGIWSIATGGPWGQGIGEGNSRVMPANHTDMILASMGEEFGFAGLFAVFVCFLLLLYRSLVIARKAAHPFAFYLVAGIAVVTSIQFLIITAGCFGLMPLTGIAVPFLSYGKVSMIFNIAAFGIVLAASKINGEKIQDEYIQKTYDNSLSFGMLSYALGAIVILGFLCYYQVFSADHYITKPAVVVNKMGQRVISENPRIELLMAKLSVGDIYDRNGLLVATSSKKKMTDSLATFISAGVPPEAIHSEANSRLKRYYPFGSHLFFWTGDYNTKLEWGSNTFGYFAENRHFSALRGLDTMDRVKNIEFTSTCFKPGRFLPAVMNHKDTLHFHNYAQLIPFLKAGIDSKAVMALDTVHKNLWLTVDAKLQTALQDSISEYLARKSQVKDSSRYHDARKWRTSVVVLNPVTGEVLASAVYPLPEEKDVLRKLEKMNPKEATHVINRISFPHSNDVFTERDLGITFPSQPGSTAKIADVLALLNKYPYDANIVGKSYRIKQPCMGNSTKVTDVSRLDDGKDHTLKEAFTKSSNLYFIQLINKEVLDSFLSNVYLPVGIGIEDTMYMRNVLNYYTFENSNRGRQERNNVKSYWQRIYNIRRRPGVPFDEEDCAAYKTVFSKLAYGEEDIKATPLAMARLVGAVVNRGVLRSSKFILDSGRVRNPGYAEAVTSPEKSYLVKGLMYLQNKTQDLRENRLKITDSLVGKTGTPSRDVSIDDSLTDARNDAWYVFSVPGASGYPIVACVRLERLFKGEDSHGLTSEVAVDVANKVVLTTLARLNYITFHYKNK